MSNIKKINRASYVSLFIGAMSLTGKTFADREIQKRDTHNDTIKVQQEQVAAVSAEFKNLESQKKSISWLEALSFIGTMGSLFGLSYYGRLLEREVWLKKINKDNER